MRLHLEKRLFTAYVTLVAARRPHGARALWHIGWGEVAS